MPFEGKSKHDKLFIRLSFNVVTRDVDRDVSTAYCQSSSSDGVDSLPFVFALVYRGNLMRLADFDRH